MLRLDQGAFIKEIRWTRTFAVYVEINLKYCTWCLLNRNLATCVWMSTNVFHTFPKVWNVKSRIMFMSKLKGKENAFQEKQNCLQKYFISFKMILKNLCVKCVCLHIYFEE